MNQVSQAQASEATRNAVEYTPPFDIWENAEEIVLCGDLPGVATEHLEVRFEDHELLITGRVEAREDLPRELLKEYGVGDFRRSFTIGEAIDTERISAEMKHGVLTIHLPKSSAVKPRKIDVVAG